MRHVAERQDSPSGKSLTEPVFLILTSLLDQPRHGYALLQEIKRISNGRVRLSTGTLYTALRRLLEDGWITRFSQPDTSRDKQAYALTAAGHGHLSAEVERMRRLASLAAMRLKRAVPMV